MNATRSRWIFAGLLLSLLILIAWVLHPYKTYADEFRRIQGVVDSLIERRPPDINAEAWKVGVGWTRTAFGNICFSREHTTMEAMSRFGRQLDERLQSELDSGTLDWIWDRLAETGPSGMRYIDRHRRPMHEEMGGVAKE